MDAPYALDYKLNNAFDDNLEYFFQQKLGFNKPDNPDKPDKSDKPDKPDKPNKSELFKVFETLNLNNK